MKCQNCGEKEANYKYTQIINGVKKQMNLCSECAKDLGLDEMNFSMPINFSNFLSDMFDVYNENDLFLFDNFKNEISCKNCNMTYQDFLNEGKFGCKDCYDTFKNQIDILLKNIHGANRHVGRIGRYLSEDNGSIDKKTHIKDNQNKEDIDNKKRENKEQRKTENKKESKKVTVDKMEELQKRLKLEIKEERYEDAAKTRDEIKLLKQE